MKRKIKSYTGISTFPCHEIKDVEIDYGNKDFDESVTDFSHFQPMREITRTISLGDVNLNAFYDFPDGKDDGSNFPLGRKKGVDLADLSTDIREKQEIIKHEISAATKKAKDLQAFEAKMQKIDSKI